MVQAMFDILEADIVVLQETKIQRKDLSDDMVLVQGWDCYFSLPRHKKGYSGVVIYTRQSVCAPIRSEEGVTGLLCPFNSSTAFMDHPEEQQIGGYPTPAQLAELTVDATTLDSEGRCIILEFPAFVLVGVYCPANRDETRDDFRLGFLDVLDARIRNLVALGKRVFLTGDLNISREELDAANVEASMRKQGLTGSEFVSTPARRLFNHMLEGGKVFGGRDEGREAPVMWDICRAFHPDRQGMFTCWEQKVNARPGNCGARIDYVLCSLDMKDWFSDSNIQEGLMGSDHCPVYAVMGDRIAMDGKECFVQDVMNPPGMFLDGKRQREYSATTDPLPLSGRLIPEFSGRRNIRDMFSRKPSLSRAQSSEVSKTETDSSVQLAQEVKPLVPQCLNKVESSQVSITSKTSVSAPSPPAMTKKRSAPEAPASNSVKRGRLEPTPPTAPPNAKGQQSLKGFFKAKSTSAADTQSTSEDQDPSLLGRTTAPTLAVAAGMLERSRTPDSESRTVESRDSSATASPLALRGGGSEGKDNVHDPIESKESWSKLFKKPAAPRCESHDEPCISMLTKKQGMNLGRSFWMCPRPLGPSGQKEKNTQWRCGTFIWCSDWNPKAASAG